MTMDDEPGIMGQGAARFPPATMRARAHVLEGNPAQLDSASSSHVPVLAMQAIIVPGASTSHDTLVAGVAIPWFRIVKLLEADPRSIYALDWRQWEEVIAGAYAEQGYEVVLTPRSGDGGRDVIATREGVGCIRILDQVKCYSPSHLVSADEVRSMLGVLSVESNASKGVVTTTSGFAPGIERDEGIARFLPYRLELKPRDVFLSWLSSIANEAQRG